ncbi:MAG: hypothetical protein IPH58_16775 [Sphingobacteriales bacterium]|nr:hypothetical protein [Sphingobacteriales bacterium]
MVFTLAGFCQTYENEKGVFSPSWVSKLGYWVIETNIHTPEHSIIRFYDNTHVMVYQETITGVVLNIKKRKIKIQLKKMLEQAIEAYTHKQNFYSNTIEKNSFKKTN